MKKISFIVDGGQTMSEEDMKKANTKKINFKIYVGDKEYSDDSSEINFERAMKDFSNNILYKTASTPLGEVQNTIESLLKENDYVIIFTIHKSLSSQNDSIKMLLSDFESKDRVFLIDSYLIGYGVEYLIHKAIEMNNSGVNINEIIKYIDLEQHNIKSYFTCETWKGIASIGRFKVALGKVFDKIQVYPIIEVSTKKCLAGISRKYDKNIDKIIKYYKKDTNYNPNMKCEFICIYYSVTNQNIIDNIKEKLSAEFGIAKENILERHIPIAYFSFMQKNSYAISFLYK